MFVLNKIRLSKFPWNKAGSLRSILVFFRKSRSITRWLHQYDWLLGQFYPFLSLFSVSLFLLRYLWYASAQSLATFVLLLTNLTLIVVIQLSHNIFDVKIPHLLHLILCSHFKWFEMLYNQFFRYLARKWKACISEQIPKSENAWKCILENLSLQVQLDNCSK